MSEADVAAQTGAEALAELTALAREMTQRQAADPFANPVLGMALAVSRRLDDGSLDLDQLEALVRRLRDQAFEARAARLGAYASGGASNPGPGGGTGTEPPTERPVEPQARFRQLAERLIRPDPLDSPVPLAAFRAAIERIRYAAVFTAHPTFALAPEAYAALAESASGTRHLPDLGSQRPPPITLEEEFSHAGAAIGRARDAIDGLNTALLEEARRIWPHAWSTLVPRPLIVTSWVGYDTDGRTDIGWWDTIRLRLRMKRMQLERIRGQLAGLQAPPDALIGRLDAALDAVDGQIGAAPASADPPGVARFAAALIDGRDAAIRSADDLAPALGACLEAAAEPDRLPLAVIRAGLLSHGLAAAHTHVRLNAIQLHNVARARLGITDSPENPAQRRALLSAVNDALERVEAIPVDFGSLLAEQASAARLMMVVAQIAKHIDAGSPIRFLIAETESGYTLLAALWLARLFGIERQIEISPLFETRQALEHGALIIEEALRSPHWRDYLRRTGRMALQFGYSDSGRYVGQLAATYLIERLRLKAAELLRKYQLADVELILFDTHGESIGRGAHPFRMADRLDYLSPARCRANFTAAGVAWREESAFQGGDGYLHFGTPTLALATVASLAEHVFAVVRRDEDPVYDEPDFTTDFFSTIASGMIDLVEDPGYAALLGAFGPALIDRTGSRPPARQSDSSGGAARIRHPSELRAIPNNAILQQLGWCANTLQGLGLAVSRHPDTFDEYRAKSARFRRALDFAAHALAHSDGDVLRAIVLTLDPGVWLDRAAHEPDASRREALMTLARGLERLDLWSSTQSMFRRIQADHLALRVAWPEAPRMALEETLLHSIRLAVIERIWLLSTRIPFFAPRNGLSRQDLEDHILRLDIPFAMAQLATIFPRPAGEDSMLDFREPRAPRHDQPYARENQEIFAPIARLFALLRETSVAVMHAVGAFG